ncbi:hypothetical protein MON38_16235 [Hymenobacter sp. DH14]|uniref:Uncharacterized protein n=1 Tax=Hymenobacter cyanobacteriorum TaxID=2926463 RepID=A0A9X1VIN5_9BACT|nr:hypothetical protein [Hymenobacter cyanobacteriorum]MCI1188972.1 hypothetical protein [Hymenobacter cyanobacteriorum]
MNYFLFAFGLFGLLFSVQPRLEKTYYSANNRIGAHAFTMKLTIAPGGYSYTKYQTIATPFYQVTGEYKMKSDTLVLWKHKIVTVDYRDKPHPKQVSICPASKMYPCDPDYYLIRQDSLLSIYYSKETHSYQKGTLMFVASH